MGLLIALDPNLLVRLLIDDDPPQPSRVADPIDAGPACGVPITEGPDPDPAPASGAGAAGPGVVVPAVQES
jgi:hypothetical protein